MGRCPGGFTSIGIVACAVVISIASPGHAFAQGDDESHWGVSGAVSSTWTAYDTLRETLLNFQGPGTVQGSEWSIGVVRGRTRGGEWGVSFVRKPFKDGSGSVFSEEGFTETRVTQAVALKGVEFHWFVPFATIKQRVQVGLNAGVGVASVEGQVLETQISEFSIPQGFPASLADQICASYQAASCRLTSAGLETTELRSAKDVFYQIQPLGKLEIAGAVIVAPGLKVRVSGGLNVPSATSFRVGLVYLIGAN